MITSILHDIIGRSIITINHRCMEEEWATEDTAVATVATVAATDHIAE